MRTVTRRVTAVLVIASATSFASATLFTISGNPSTAPTSTPTIHVGQGMPLNLYLFGQAQGTGKLLAASVGLFQSSAASYAGGVVSPTNPLPAPAASLAAGSVANTYAPNITDIFSNSRLNPMFGAVNGGSLMIGNIGGANLSAPPNGIDATGAKLISTISFTATSTVGTYYLYLGRTGSGAVESPSYKDPVFLGGQGTSASVNNTSNFGFGSTAVATAGAGPNGSVANTLSNLPTAIVVVDFIEPPASITVTAGGVNPNTIAGPDGGFSPASDSTAPYEFNFNVANTGHTIVALDFGANATPDLSALPGYTTTNSFGFASNYDAFFDLGTPAASTGTTAAFTVDIAGIPGIASVAVVPEPTGLALLCPLIPPFLRRSRRD